MRRYISRLSGILFSLPADSLSEESTRKALMLYTIVLLGVFFLIVLGTAAYFEADYVLTLLDLTVALFLIGLYFWVRLTGRIKAGSILGTTVVLIFFFVLFITGAARQQGFLWYYTYPLISLFLLGIPLGSLFSLLLIGLTVLVFLLRDIIPFFTPYMTGLPMRFFFTYMTVFLFTLIFEETRQTTRMKLEDTLSELNELVIRDSLTGLYNRRYFDQVLCRVIQQCNRMGTVVAFLMIDLDYFKNYNDAYGHRAGDVVLNTFASVLASNVRRETDHAFRYGGEEFAMLLLPTSRETAEEFARTIIENTRALAIPHEKSPFGRLTVSIGIAILSAGRGIKYQHMVDLADKALYAAKDRGRDCFVVRDEISLSST